MLTSGVHIKSVKADVPITCINADGSVTPPTTPISTIDNVTYTLTGDVSGRIIVKRNGIVLDGNGFTLGVPPFGGGLDMSSTTNVTAENLNFGVWPGIWLTNSSNDTVASNNIFGADYSGIYLDGANGNVISGNNISGCYWAGIQLVNSSNNTISGNVLTENHFGIMFARAQLDEYNTLTNNVMANNTCNFSLFTAFGALSYNLSMNSIDSSNTVNGKPMYYWFDKHDMAVPSDAGFVALGNCTGIIVQNMSIRNNDPGIYLSSTSNCTITNNNITNNSIGIDLCSSSNNSIYHNNFINNSNRAQVLGDNTWDNGYPSGGNCWSDYTGVDVKKGLNQDEPGSDGIGDTPYTVDSSNLDHFPLAYPYGSPPPPTHALTITPTINGTTDPAPGTYLYSQGQSVPVQAMPDTGYMLDHWELDDVNAGGANPIGVAMAANHTVYPVFSWRGICNLTIITTAGGTTNPMPGIYNYTNGATVNVTAMPDTRYAFGHWELDGNNVGATDPINVTMDTDHTLHAVFTEHHDVAITSVALSKTVVGQGYSTSMNITVANEGDYTETFNVTVYANTILIGNQTVNNLLNGTSTVLTFIWNTTSFAYSNYTISTYAGPVPGDTNTTNNTFTDENVTVTIPGDISGDFKVDLKDLVILANAYGSIYPHPPEFPPKWNPNADINGDSKIGLSDLVILALHYGQHYP
jgi:parallel beta-helix repeat protein